jgi:putative salt-induced outer membrane protein YdiY
MSFVNKDSVLAVVVFASALLLPSRVLAQQPCPCATPVDQGTWIGTAGAGLSVTSGNSDTLNFNVSYDITRDPKTRNVVTSKGLFIRGQEDGTTVANRLSLGFRDQYRFNDGAFVFGQVDYLRDTFKLIDYLVAPTMGVGYKVIDTTPTKFAVDGGMGAVFEKNPDEEVSTNVALTAGERFERALSPTSSLHHSATALWRADELADGLYTISIGLGAKLSNPLQLSVDLLDTFKNRPPTEATKRNDVALVTAITTTF